MARTKVFVSYSHAEKDIRDEVLRSLRAVPRINKVLWWDEEEIAIGDKFHAKIQQGLAESRIGILLLSNHSFTSDYILQHELPYLIEHAEAGDLKLGCLYLTAMAEAAFIREIESNGQKRTIDLKEYLGAHAPQEPLDRLDPGARAQVYKELTDWAASVLDVPEDRKDLQRYELGVTLRVQRDYWEHSFWLPPATPLQRPSLHVPDPDELFGMPGELIDGENLFRLLFGSELHKSSNILGAAFGMPSPVDPTRAPLRLRLSTNDERLWALPWGKIAYQGRRLAEVGWTVELHHASAPGLPEYPVHTCYFPGKVLLLGAQDYLHTPQGAAHLTDVEHFFQSRWPRDAEPIRVHTSLDLRDRLRTGATRLLYYFGSASSEGLLVHGAQDLVSWSELASLLEQTPVSVVFLNLLGEDSFAAMAPVRHLLPGAWAVLVQCRARSEVDSAGREALDWLQHVFAANPALDPVAALFRQPRGLVTAWTRYGSWRTTPLPRFDVPELVERLLDRHRQRNDLAGAKEEFYTFTERRIHHVVALGETGAKVAGFPLMVSQHLRETKREQEVFRHHSFTLNTGMNTIERVDQRVRQELGIGPRASVSGALLKTDTLTGHGFWFLVLGWVLSHRMEDDNIEAVAVLLRAVADWCRNRLLPELPANQTGINIRAVSIAAIETASGTGLEQLRDIVDAMHLELNDTESFHAGELEPLARVRLTDLTSYFRNRQICSCHDLYRDRFPKMLLGERRDMPFDEAVDTIRRGYPDNWGNLYTELEEMTQAREWPPTNYDSTFWETRDGR
jgi:hypothetical protein